MLRWHPVDEPEIPTIGAALRLGSARLHRLDLQTADLEAALLLGLVTGLERLDLITHTGAALTAAQWERFQDLLARREKHEPLQYLTGTQEFMSLAFDVTPAVLIPRPETEHLVEAILDLEEDAGAAAPEEPGRLAADVGTGSGAIAVALASYVTTLRLVATDISAEALDIARSNAQRHGVAARVEFRQGAGLAPLADLAGKLDYLVSNPPYIPTAEIGALDPEVRDWEPHQALDGGPDGLALIRDLAGEGASLVKPGGHLALEVMAGQAPAVMALLETADSWEDVRAVPDYGGHLRVVLATRA